MVHRRSLLKSAAVGGVVALAGCSSVVSPDPEVVRTVVGNAYVGETEIIVLVVNGGRAGSIRVTLIFRDRTGEPIEELSKVVDISSNGQEEVRFRTAVPSGTEEYVIATTVE